MFPRKFLKKALSLFVLIGFLSVSVYSVDKTDENYQRVIPLDSEIYPLVELISRESGQVLLSAVRPWSEAEVLNILDNIDKSQLSVSGESAFDRVKLLIIKKPVLSEDDIALQVGVEAAVELYLHSSPNEDIWEYGYEERLPVISLPIEAWLNENFYACVDFSIRESRFLIPAVDADGNYMGNITNIPMSFAEINYHFPDRAFLSAGGENWNVQIGRDQFESGNGETGKLLLSSYADFYDFLKIKGFSDNFAFTWTYINLQNWAADGSVSAGQRAFVDHAIETRLFEILTLYINESIILFDADPQLQFINPLLIYHNFFIRENANSLVSAGFNLVPLPGISLYGELAVDQVQTGLEQELYGTGVTATPNADGHLLGIKASYPLGPGYINGFFEYIYTSPWLYLRAPTEATFYWLHRETTDILKARANVIKPLGYEYGPDTIAFAGEVGYFLPGIFSAAFTVDYIIKGENNIETEYLTGAVAAQMISPTGTPQNKLVLSLNGSYQIFSFLTAQLDLAWLYINNYQHISSASVYDFQSAASLVFKI